MYLNGKDRDYTTASIPRDLAIRAEKVLSRLGYQSLSEFVRDAIRRRLDELEKEVSPQ